MLPSNLAQKWRELAAQEKTLGADAQAKTLEWCAAELEQAQREWELEELTLHEAAEESGYTYSSLQKMVASGQLENVGDKGCPRVRRGDLPRKPTHQASRTEDGEPDLAGELLSGAISG